MYSDLQNVLHNESRSTTVDVTEQLHSPAFEDIYWFAEGLAHQLEPMWLCHSIDKLWETKSEDVPTKVVQTYLSDV